MIAKLYKNYRRICQVSSLLVIDLVFFGSTNPAKVASFILMVGFVLFIATLYCLFTGIIMLCRFYGLKFSHKRQVASYLSVVVGALVALQSIGELTIRDILVLIPMAIMGYFYSSYAVTKQPDLET